MDLFDILRPGDLVSIVLHGIVFGLVWAASHRSLGDRFTRDDRIVLGFLVGFALLCDVANAWPFDQLVALLISEGPLESVEPPALLGIAVLLLVGGIVYRPRSRWTRMAYIGCGLLFVWFCLLEISFGAEIPQLGPPGPIRQAFINARPKQPLEDMSRLGVVILGVWTLVTGAFKVLLLGIILDPSLGTEPVRGLGELRASIGSRYGGAGGKFVLLSRLMLIVCLATGSFLLPASAGHLDNEVNQTAFILASAIYVLAVLYPRLRQTDLPARVPSTPRRRRLVRAALAVWVLAFAAHTSLPLYAGIPSAFVVDADHPQDCAKRVRTHSLTAYAIGPWVEVRGVADYAQDDPNLRELMFAYRLIGEGGNVLSEGWFPLYTGTKEHHQPLGKGSNQYFRETVRCSEPVKRVILSVATCSE